jgi:PAS domain S-box-containing protein
MTAIGSAAPGGLDGEPNSPLGPSRTPHPVTVSAQTDEQDAASAAALDTLRAIAAGEVDAFVVSDGESSHTVHSLSTADRPYQMFVENMRDGAATVTAAGEILYVNNRLAELLGRSKEDLIGAALAPLLAGDVPENWHAPAGVEDVGATLELELIDGDGLHVPVLVGASPLGVDGEQLTCLTFTDLTAQRAQEREIAGLYESQLADGLRHAAVVAALQEGVLVQDGLGRVLEANQTAAEILGVALDQLVTDPPTPLSWRSAKLDGRAVAAGHTPGRRALVDGDPQMGLLVSFDRGDEAVWLELNCVPFRVPGASDVPLVISSFRDVTARVAADKAIGFQARLLDSAGQAIVAVDPVGLIIYWNKQAELTYGWSSAEAIGQPIAELILTEDTLADGELTVAQIQADGTQAGEHWARRRDGTLFPLFATGSSVLDDDGNLIAMIGVATDITDRRLAEEVAKASQQELLKARHTAEMEAMARDAATRSNRAKSEFLSRMSHELRTPLNAVLGFGQILLMDDLTTDQRENVGFIKTAGEHLLALINDVLDISRIEAGALRLSLEPVQLNEVLTHALSLIRPQADQRALSLPAGIADTDLYVHADRQRLLQVMLNLLSNAVKYNRRGGRIELCCESSGGTVSIAVSDTGIGICEADLGKLFTPFERLGAEGTEIEGTGVGLALSRVLSQQMGGALTVFSTVGVGSTFTLELPVSARSEPSPPPKTTPPLARHADSKPVTVLAIEDNVANIRLLERAMQRCDNVELLTAIQGRLGIEIASEHSPDLVLLDLHLPDMTGMTVLQHLCADPGTASIPVVICSAEASPSQARDCLERGAAGYLTKPFNLAELYEIIEHVRAGEPIGPPPSQAEATP